MYFFPINIIENVTIVSANKVDTAAPSWAYRGISQIFRTRLTNAPNAVQRITLFSCPCGYKIWIPNTLDMPIMMIIGEMICKVKIAGS